MAAAYRAPPPGPLLSPPAAAAEQTQLDRTERRRNHWQTDRQTDTQTDRQIDNEPLEVYIRTMKQEIKFIIDKIGKPGETIYP